MKIREMLHINGMPVNKFMLRNLCMLYIGKYSYYRLRRASYVEMSYLFFGYFTLDPSRISHLFLGSIRVSWRGNIAFYDYKD